MVRTLEVAMLRASSSSCRSVEMASSIMRWSRALIAMLNRSNVAFAEPTAALNALMSSPLGVGCWGTAILPREAAGTHSHHAPTFTARMRRDIARRAALLTLTSSTD